MGGCWVQHVCQQLSFRSSLSWKLLYLLCVMPVRCADLCYTTEYDRYRGAFMWTGYAMPHKSTRGGTAIQFGACRDSQASDAAPCVLKHIADVLEPVYINLVDTL